MCTDTWIVTIQVMVNTKHDAKLGGFDTLRTELRDKFLKRRSLCHVFITDQSNTAAKLRAKNFAAADELNISIYTAVLNISVFNGFHKALRFVKEPSVSRQ